MTYRAGVIGCGRIGCGFIDDPLRGPTSTHAGSYAAVEGVDLAAVCDLDVAKAQACGEAMDTWIYSDYHGMLSHQDLNIVSVCTPPETHEEIVYDVANTIGVRAIYCEKPITTSVSAAERMVRICEEQGVLLMINHQRRFSLLHQEVAHIIREGELGRIQQVTCYYGYGVSNGGSHLFDLLRFYFGEVGVVNGRWSPNASHVPGDPNIDGRLWLEGNIPIVIQACDREAYAILEIAILGTKGRLRVTSRGQRAAFERVEDCPIFTGIKELSPPVSLPYMASMHWIPRGIQHMLDCLKTGEQPISSGRDGLAALKIIEALKKSARGG